MPHSVNLAITLDEEMLGRHAVYVHPPWAPDSSLPLCADLEAQVGDRFLLKYVRSSDRNHYSVMSGVTYFSGVHYVTPTPICQGELTSVLNLPPMPAPRFALILDPSKLDARGPRRIRSGRGIEYVLANGFPRDAIVSPGWPVSVA
jgi:hypothetical protein